MLICKIDIQDKAEEDRGGSRVVEETVPESKRWESKVEEGIAGTSCIESWRIISIMHSAIEKSNSSNVFFVPETIEAQWREQQLFQ